MGILSRVDVVVEPEHKYKVECSLVTERLGSFWPEMTCQVKELWVSLDSVGLAGLFKYGVDIRIVFQNVSDGRKEKSCKCTQLGQRMLGMRRCFHSS